MQVKVSVVVPVYNVEKYIEECIESLLEQTLSDIEVILVNDGSQDKSGEICKKFSEQYSHIQLIEKENEGVSVARNEGIKSAKGEYITFVDADDYVDAFFCEKFYKAAKENTADICVCDYKFIGSEGVEKKSSFSLEGLNTIDEYKRDLILRTLYRGYGENIKNAVVSAGVTWGKFYRLDFIKKVGACFVPNLIRAQDTIFWLNLLTKTNKITYIDEALYIYRINNFSITSGGKYIEDSANAFGKLLKEYEKFIKEEGLDSEFTQAYYGRVIEVIFWHIKHNYFNEKNKFTYKEKKRDFNDLLKSQPYIQAIREIDIKMLSRHQRLFVLFARVNLGWKYVRLYEIYQLRYRKK